MGILNDVIDGGQAVLNNRINQALQSEGDSLETWARNYMLGDFEGRTIDLVKESIKNRLDSLKNQAITALNQAVNSGVDTIQNQIISSVYDRKSDIQFPTVTNFDEDIRNRERDKVSRRGFSGQRLEDFYRAFSTLQRHDRRFSMLQNYLFDVNIQIDNTGSFNPNGTSQTPKNYTKFEQLYKYYTGEDDNLQGFKLLVSSLELPNINVEKADTISTEFGYASYPSAKLLPDSNEISINILNTENSLLEGFFVEWLGEVCADRYIYENFPFHKARISVTFYQSNTLEKAFTYIFNDCFPFAVETQNPNHELTIKNTREVKLAFDYMSLENHLSNQILTRELPQNDLLISNPFITQFQSGGINTLGDIARDFLF